MGLVLDSLLLKGGKTLIITQLEAVDRSKVKVYLDGEYHFMLYNKELEQWNMEEGNELTPEQYKIIMENIIHRAKQKAINLLKFMDRTEYGLRNKLKESGYIDDVIDITIDYVKGYGYINDERYATIYIEARKKSKSRRMLTNELQRKGISKDIIDNIFQLVYEVNEEGEDPEDIAIKKEISKKIKNKADLTPELKKKIYASLFRKGYNPNKIRKHIGDIYDDNTF